VNLRRVSAEQNRTAVQARLAASAILSCAAGEGDPRQNPDAKLLDRVERIVKLGVFVSSTPDFTDQPKVANGASELMQEVFGEAGHTVSVPFTSRMGTQPTTLRLQVHRPTWMEAGMLPGRGPQVAGGARGGAR